MAKRILNRKELRADYDAAERRNTDDEDTEETEEEEGDDEEEEGEASDEAASDEEAEEEEVPVKKPARKKAPAKPRTRTRTTKTTRMRVVWGVFNNSQVCVATYEYPKRKDAEDHAAKLTADKRSTHFVQPVKEPMAEKT